MSENSCLTCLTPVFWRVQDRALQHSKTIIILRKCHQLLLIWSWPLVLCLPGRRAGQITTSSPPQPAGRRPVSSVHPLTIYIVVVSLWVVQSRHQADLFNVTRAQEDEPPTERRPKNRSDFLISIPNMNDLLWQFQIFDTNATIHRVKAAACHGD